MNTEKLNCNIVSYLKYFSEYLSIILIIIGVLVLIGWAFDIAILKSPGPNFSTIKSNAALCFILIGASLWLQQTKRVNKRNQRIAQILAVIVVLIGFLTLIEHLFNLNLGIDQIFFSEPLGTLNTSAPNRMSFPAAFMLLITGSALFILDKKIGGYRPAQILILIEGIIAFMAVMGYVYGTSSLYMIYHYTGTAIYAAITFLLIFFAVLSARPDKGFMKVMVGEGLGSVFGRKIIPLVILIPIILGGSALLGVKLGYYDVSFGAAILVISTVFVLVIVVWSAITSLNKSDKELKQVSNYNRSLIEASLDPLVTIGPDGRITDVNGATESITGLSRDDLIGTDFSNYFTEPEKAQAGYQQVFQDGLVRDYSLEIKHKKGRVTPVLYNASVYKDEYGDIIGVFAAARDITERKEAEKERENLIEELRRSNEELEKFAYVSSHDLQEPLRMVVSYIQLLERKYQGKLDEKADKYIYYAVDGAKRMQSLINDLLSYSRVNTRGGDFKSIDSESVLNKALLNLEFSIKKSDATVTHDPLPEIIGDAGQLVQLFQNLISNAIKFKKENEKPKIHISALKKGNEYVFSVSDNGIGMDPKYVDRIFEIFQRLNKRSDYQGTGIGLAISKKIVERHGGRIWVESKPGKGSNFYFTIPIKP